MGLEHRILKAAAPLPGRRIDAAVWDADLRVREMVADANDKARRLVADAEAARDRLHAEAIEAGRREGYARAAAVLAAAAEERDRLLRDAGREVVELAIAIARKVLGRELAAGDAVAALAANALAEARARRQVAVRVNPADASELRSAHGALAAVLLHAPLEIREDASIERGGVVIETEAGRIDAGIEAQLDALARALAEALP
ncbi:MAG TPA: FliH/SctL family protein [Anaeromyxobacter sp.]